EVSVGDGGAMDLGLEQVQTVGHGEPPVSATRVGAEANLTSREPVTDTDRKIDVEVDAVVGVIAKEIEGRDRLDEDVERHVVEVERDSQRHADAERLGAGAATARAGVVEEPHAAADADVERQLERLGGRED